MASTLTLVFIGLLIATTLTRLWLGSRHIGYVQAHRGQVPQAFKQSQQKEIARVRAIYQAGGSQPGDASKGRALYNQLCAQCHHLFDFGGAVGPDITGANRGDVTYLLENILFPNAVIPIDYRVSTIEMKDDRVLTGIVKERTPQALVVQTPNEKLTLPLAEVKKVETSEFSMMPEGLIAQLNDQQVRDLLYYLGRPGQVPLPAGAK